MGLRGEKLCADVVLMASITQMKEHLRAHALPMNLGDCRIGQKCRTPPASA